MPRAKKTTTKKKAPTKKTPAHAATRSGLESSKRTPAAKKKTPKIKEVVIPPIKRDVAIMRLVGLSALICRAWDPLVIQHLLDIYTDKPHTKKPPKDPDREYETSLYKFSDDSYGFPGTAFRKAAIGACRQIDGLNMTDARGMFNVLDDLVEIKGTPRRRQDIVGIGKGGSPDIRFRAEFPKWEALVPVHYNTAVITLPQLANLFNLGGFAVGVGEWRPEKEGRYGMFEVKAIG